MDGVEIRELDVFEDERGSLVKILKKEYLGGAEIGEIYMTMSAPGVTRGNHYHKKTTEWFCVIKGEACLYLSDIVSGEKREIKIDKGVMVLVKVPAGVAHAVRNTGAGWMSMIAIADRAYQEYDPDTFPYAALP
jgi:dTDP-4-dehydrorhamnose 3,5-epimerase